MNDTAWAIYIVMGVICGALAAIIGHSKGRDWPAWAVIGFFFGILGLLAAIGVSDNTTKGQDK